jgi:lipopolysaccharide transport system permease protein
MITATSEKIYTPASDLRSPGHLAASMLSDLMAGRELAWRLFVRNINANYRQTFLGYIWAFLPPLATTATFVFLNSQNILRIGATPIPYPAYVLIGSMLWQTFVDAMNSPLRMVSTSTSMLAKINFPREALILAGIYEVLFNFLIRISLIAGAFFWFGLEIHWTLFLVPFGILALIAFGLVLGVVLVPIGILYRDVQLGLVIVTNFWMILTPVVYPPATQGIAGWLAQWNPVSPLIITVRAWMTTGATPLLGSFLLISALTLLIGLAGWVLCRISMPYLIERMGG